MSDIVAELRSNGGRGKLAKLVLEAADTIEKQAEQIGNLCLTIAFAADDLSDGDEPGALAMLRHAMAENGISND